MMSHEMDMHDHLCNRHETTATFDTVCPDCRLESLQTERDALQVRVAELQSTHKADCIAFAQWFRSGANRTGRTEDECYRLWTELREALEVGDE